MRSRMETDKTTSYIEMKEVSVIFRSDRSQKKETVALDGFSLDVKKHEFVSIIGPSGCGKTTLLRVLAGLILPTSGEVLIDSTTVVAPGPERAMVFQEYVLLPWGNALYNVEFGLKLQGVPRKKRQETAMELIRLVGLEGFEDHYPHELSGGMRQRVGLARALAVDPDILLMDEPFGSLDAQTRELMQDELLKIWERQRKTVIFSTHSIEEAIYLSDRIVIMTPRPGRVKDVIPVELARPRTYSQKVSAEFTDLRLLIWNKLKPR